MVAHRQAISPDWSSVTMTVVTGTVHERLVVLKGLNTAL